MPFLNPTAEADAFTWQVQAMADLAEFLHAHGPESSAPLPSVPWSFGQGGTVTAEVSTRSDFPDQAARALVALNAFAVLNDFAEALGTQVEYHLSEDRMRVVALVQGRVGPAGTDDRRRTLLLLSATAHHDEPLEVDC